MLAPPLKPWMPSVTRALSSELSRLRLRNPRFSQRAFARRLDLGSSALSEILGQKRNLSRKAAVRVLSSIGADPASVVRSPGIGRPLKTKELSYDQFALIADWHHTAILSLLETKGSRGMPAWLSRRLNIDERTLEQSIQRLIRLGLLARGPRGTISLVETDTAGPDGAPDLALRRHHLEGLALAEHSLLEDPIEARDFSAMTLAMPTKKIPEARRRIRRFVGELTQWLESSSERDEVYRVAVQLFPLTRDPRKSRAPLISTDSGGK